MTTQETTDSGWKDNIKSTQENFRSLQLVDAKLDTEQISSDIEKVINSSSGIANRRGSLARTSSFQERLQHAKLSSSNAVGNSSTVPSNSSNKGEEDLNSMADIYGKEEASSPPPRIPRPPVSNRLVPNPMNPGTPGGGPPSPTAPESSDRFSKAKVSLLTKQVQDGIDLRNKLEEQVRDLQRQLNQAREDNRHTNKRVQQLELEIKKGNHPKRGPEPSAPIHDTATAEELAKARKDLETAERLAKQADQNVKSKDAQLKRALETITRLKTQLQEAHTQITNGSSGDQTRMEALEQRVKTLEKQRGELVEGFRKQMKLIDVLKRQKLHLEAARLLNFTEEEFMKTLEWNA